MALIITFPYQFVCSYEIPVKQTILILGDSLSAGYGISQGSNWTDLLQKKFAQQDKNILLINASISGDTTANGLKRLSKALKQHQPEIMIIELGANDGLRGLSISHIKENLRLLIQAGLDAQVEVLLMEIKIPPNYGKKYTQAFNRIYHNLAREYSLLLLPFLLENIAVNPDLMQTDGLHPNEKAQTAISEAIWQSLKPLF
ncbi:MAG: arylesterase [gamma proteobacterium symbiont of Taylorina sp.]|nr:arylesterase [gamma proteobacterium symbiont of Taylorina sp.]